MNSRIEIVQYSNVVATLPAPDNKTEISDTDRLLAESVADVLLMHNRLEIGYYQIVLVGPIGDSGLVGPIDALEAVA